MKVTRIVVAFLVAAIVAALFPFIVACGGGPIFAGKCDVDFGWGPFALAITLAATLFIAVPLFILFWKMGWLKWWQAAFGGAIVGLLSSVVLQFADSGSSMGWYQFAMISAPLGAISGLVFWGVGVRRKPA